MEHFFNGTASPTAVPFIDWNSIFGKAAHATPGLRMSFSSQLQHGLLGSLRWTIWTALSLRPAFSERNSVSVSEDVNCKLLEMAGLGYGSTVPVKVDAFKQQEEQQQLALPMAF